MNLNKMTIEDVQVKGKKVLVRCDFNVPLDADKNITDETRINAALPTIKYLLDNGAAVILCSHLGRPKGEFNMKYSLAPVAKRLSEKLGFEVKLAKDVIGPDAKKLAAEVKPGEAVLLENVRFHAEEEKNDPAFAKELASMAELYVSDAFGTVHRAHASTAGVADYLPAVAGYLIGKELNFLGVIPTQESTVLMGKLRASQMNLSIAQELGADGVIVSEEGYGNPDTDLCLNAKNFERAGIKSVVVSDEAAGTDGASQSLADATPEMTGFVSCGNVNEMLEVPAMEKVIGWPASIAHLSGGAAESLRKDGSMYVEMQAIIASTAEIGYNKVGCDWI